MTSPVRYPDLRSGPLMTRRAWWLIALNVLIPGSPQLIAGNRRLGRFGVTTTFILWALAVLALVIFLLNHEVIYTAVTNPVALTLLQVLLVAYAILWIVLTLDTLRLTKLVRTGSAAPFIAVIAVLALVVTAGVASYGAVSAGAARGAVSKIFAGQAYAPPVKGRYNILLLGGDAGADRTGLRPDSLSVASIDAETGATTIIGIPRNLEQVQFVAGSPLYGPFPGGYNCGDKCLIDYLYTYGEEHEKLYPDAVAKGSTPGIEAMRDASEGVTGLTIQFYALIDMQGFADLVDALGGVTVDVPARIAYGPVTATKPYGYFDAGKQRLDGGLALWYARSRYAGSDYERMARQRQVQEAILKQFQPAIVLTKFQDIAKAGAQVVKTDIPASMLGHLVEIGEKGRKLPVAQLELVPPIYSSDHPDFDKMRAAVTAAVAPVKASSTPTP
jgi:LCP family protein required for cell wall assembly